MRIDLYEAIMRAGMADYRPSRHSRIDRYTMPFLPDTAANTYSEPPPTGGARQLRR